ncbi:MAG: tRNA 2-selenouridine(34) synthase MnmH [Porphyromonas sp.]|nr:tRNA 2-selenouridine(34) synthase MnmH [Porphyromonas sp.]
MNTMPLFDGQRLWIDVRSPKEYERGHIPSAVNIPLFDDRERALVGTAYAHKGRKAAISLGLKLIAHRLPLLEAQIEKSMRGGYTRPLVIYCARGGMRSSSVAWLLRLYGYDVSVYPGGYKSYRGLLVQLLQRCRRIVLLEGKTGVGKTHILKALAGSGLQVIDLENLAKHRGSAFGYYPDQSQPTTEMLSNEIISELLKMDPDRPIFIESESKRIGSVDIPDSFFERMKTADFVRISSPMEQRIERILNDYRSIPIEKLQSAFDKISRRLGAERTRDAKVATERGEYREAIGLALKYYDKAYCASSKKLFRGNELFQFEFGQEGDLSSLIERLSSLDL